MGVSKARLITSAEDVLPGGSLLRKAGLRKGIYPTMASYPGEPESAQQQRLAKASAEKGAYEPGHYSNLGNSTNKAIDYLRNNFGVNASKAGENVGLGTEKSTALEGLNPIRAMGAEDTGNTLRRLTKEAGKNKMRKIGDVNKKLREKGLQELPKTARQLKYDKEKAKDYKNKIASGKKLTSAQQSWLDDHNKEQRALARASKKAGTLKKASAEKLPVNKNKEAKKEIAKTMPTPSISKGDYNLDNYVAALPRITDAKRRADAQNTIRRIYEEAAGDARDIAKSLKDSGFASPKDFIERYQPAKPKKEKKPKTKASKKVTKKKKKAKTPGAEPLFGV